MLGCDMLQEDDLKAESDFASGADHVTAIHSSEVAQQFAPACRYGKQKEADESRSHTEDCPVICLLPPEECEEDRHQHHGNSRQEGGFRGCRVDEPLGLKFISCPKECSCNDAVAQSRRFDAAQLSP